MKIELSGVKHFASMSEETPCFEATVVIDGVKAGRVSNHGTGGPHDFHPWEMEQRLAEHAKTLPAIVARFDDSATGKPFTYSASAETIIDDLLTTWLVARDLRRALAGKILFVKADGKIYETKRMDKTQMTASLTPARLDALRQRNGATAILNTLPFDEALAAYRAVEKGGERCNG